MGRFFGTDGVRGLANKGAMTAEMMVKLGRATAHICKKYENHQRHRIVIGKDTRVSGYMLESALIAGICSMGVDVLLVGPMPTPGISFITRNMRADAGLVISASHNPYQDNGIKIFAHTGYKLPDSVENEIEELILSGGIDDIRPTADTIGKAKRIDDAMGRYIVFCKNTFSGTMSIEGMKIVLDCANGATYKIAPLIFSELGAEVVSIHNRPNGKNINDGCGSQHTKDLQKKVLELHADIGLAFDGDGDRLIVVDEKGNELSGDHLLYICAKMYKERGLLSNNKMVATVMSNFGLGLACKEAGIEMLKSDVGDRYVLEMMLAEESVLGGEASGHMIFHDHHTTGDGIISALQVLTAIKHFNKPISTLGEGLRMFPQKLVNLTVAEKPLIEDLPALVQTIKDAEAVLGDQGRVLVRYSGTQSICRVMVEGPTEEMVNELCEQLSAAVVAAIG